jgi:hypothetical protein
VKNIKFKKECTEFCECNYVVAVIKGKEYDLSIMREAKQAMRLAYEAGKEEKGGKEMNDMEFILSYSEFGTAHNGVAIIKKERYDLYNLEKVVQAIKAAYKLGLENSHEGDKE